MQTTTNEMVMMSRSTPKRLMNPITPDMIEIQIGLRRRQRGKSYYTNQGIALALIVKMIEPLILLQQKMNVG